MFVCLRRFLATLGLMLATIVAGAVSVAPPVAGERRSDFAAWETVNPLQLTRASAAQDAGDAGVVSPAQDPFYLPPSPLPAGAPGTILRSRPVTVSMRGGGLLPSAVSAIQVLYLSTSALGAPTAVSGTVLVPDTPWAGAGPRPLVTYAIGTHGLGDQCAPSYRLRTGTEGESGLMNQPLDRGWAVVVTDYEGLGTPGTHTYAVGIAEGHAVLDAARAAQHALASAGPVGIWGYSQGGQAAAWAGELQPSYAPELHVAGVAAGGVPADVSAVARHLDGGPAAGLVVAGAVGYGTAYPDLALDSFLNDAGKAAAAQVAGSCTGDIVARNAFHHMADYTTIPDPLGDPRFTRRTAENHAGRRAPGAPVFLYQGTADELIPLEVARQLFADYCGLKASVLWRELPLQSHVGAAAAGGPVAVAWLDERFGGLGPPSSC